MIDVDSAAVVLDDVTLLSPVSLSVPVGTWHVIRGANGSGKSTLLSLIGGRRKPTTGSVLLAKKRPDSRSTRFRAEVASLLAPPITARDLTLLEHLTLIAASWKEQDPPDAAIEQLEHWGIEQLALRFPHELSSGQKQLFALSSVFIRPAGVLILDEPEQRLDAQRRALLVETVRDRLSHGATVVMASHAEDVAIAADETTWLSPRP